MILSYQITDLKEFKCWQGAKFNYDWIIRLGLSEEFIEFIEEYFDEFDNDTERKLNDLLWFETDIIRSFIKNSNIPLKKKLDFALCTYDEEELIEYINEIVNEDTEELPF